MPSGRCSRRSGAASAPTRPIIAVKMSVPVAPLRTLRAADELLQDRDADERAEREADARTPRRGCRARRPPAPVTIAAATGQVNCWTRFEIVDLRHASSGAMPVSSSSDQPDRQHPLVEERRPDGQPLAAHRFAQRREHRREQDEERREQQDPVVREERRFARDPRVELVARLQQRQPVDHQAEAER